jgi:hypothetical protein
MAVSLTNYIISEPRHQFHRRFANPIHTFDERLLAVIEGVPGDRHSHCLLSVSERLAKYAEWLEDGSVCVVRFEDLVGPAGGGDERVQLETVQRISDHIERPLNTAEARRVAAKVFSQKSATFHGGYIERWKKVFKDRHKSAFKSQAQTYLEALGYVSHANW